MEIVDHESSGENTDELLSAEVDDSVDVYELIPLTLSHDHCDRLLDAIDAQLNHIQIHSHLQMHECASKRNEFPSSTGYLDRSLSLSKDTGLGSTVPTNDKTTSTPDWTPSEGKGDQAENQTVEILKVTNVWHPDGNGLCSASRNEQCRWRLERLLGKGSEVTGIRNEEDELTMDSICTEDFSTRFRDEMIDPGKGVAPAPDVPSTSSDTSDLNMTQRNPHNEWSNNPTQHLSKTPIRQLTGIPMQSFDSVTIDTDLDTVCSEKVRRYLKSALSNKTGFHFRRKSVFCTEPAIQSNIQSFSSDDEETSGEGSVSKHYTRGRRNPPSRNGKKRSSHQSKINVSYTSLERPRDKIRINEDQLKELKLSVAKLQQQKIAVVYTLEKLRKEMDQTKTEQQSLQIIMKDSRAQAQNIRCELHRLQVQKDICLEEVRVLQEQQDNLLQRPKNYDISCHNCVSRNVSILEREEMDRLLDNAKSELFSEQRRFRHTIDSMQERLDEVNQEMEQKDEDFRFLQQKCIGLEKQLADTIRETDQIKQSSQQDLKQQVSRFEAMERTVAQKDLLLRGLEEEKKALHLELSSLREEHSLKLKELQNRMKKEKEQEINQLNLQLTKRHQEELQMMKDEEVKRFKAALDQHAGEMRRQAEELSSQTQEKIEKALKQEERKWVEQREKALREQRGILEKQIEEAVKRGKLEVEKERRKTLELQGKVSELQRQTEKDVVHLKESLQCSEQELRHLRAALSERDQKHQRRTARLERQIGNWAQDIHTECVCLQELLKHNGLTVKSKHLPDSPTVPEALQALQFLTKAIQQLINDLKNEISSQKRTAQHLSIDKERELHVQKEQMTEEKKQALASLKEKLIQEHVEEMSGLCRTNMADDNETDGLMARMHRQLQAKDDELRLVQKNMAEWKDKTTARLAHKFQLELTAEMDRRVPKPQAEQQKRLERMENEMRHLTGYRDHKESQLSSTALQSGPYSQHTPNTNDLTSYKLLQHLQSRIRQLKESQARCPSPVKWDRDDRNLGGSYLDTIAPAQECYKTEGCIPTRTFCS